MERFGFRITCLRPQKGRSERGFKTASWAHRRKEQKMTGVEGTRDGGNPGVREIESSLQRGNHSRRSDGGVSQRGDGGVHDIA